jgi:hypothetical protein
MSGCDGEIGLDEDSLTYDFPPSHPKHLGVLRCIRTLNFGAYNKKGIGYEEHCSDTIPARGKKSATAYRCLPACEPIGRLWCRTCPLLIKLQQLFKLKLIELFKFVQLFKQLRPHLLIQLVKLQLI